jgi:hypothetical protein
MIIFSSCSSDGRKEERRKKKGRVWKEESGYEVGRR